MTPRVTKITLETRDSDHLAAALRRLADEVEVNPMLRDPQRPVGIDFKTTLRGEAVQVKGLVW